MNVTVQSYPYDPELLEVHLPKGVWGRENTVQVLDTCADNFIPVEVIKVVWDVMYRKCLYLLVRCSTLPTSLQSILNGDAPAMYCSVCHPEWCKYPVCKHYPVPVLAPEYID